MTNKLRAGSSLGSTPFSPFTRMLLWSLLLTAVQVASAQEWCICECPDNNRNGHHHHSKSGIVTLLHTITLKETTTITFHRTVTPQETVAVDPTVAYSADPDPVATTDSDPGPVATVDPDPAATGDPDPVATIGPDPATARLRESYASQSLSTVSLTATVPVVTSVISSDTVQILPSPTGTSPDTTGTVVSTLETSGRPSLPPILTSSISSPTSLLAAASTLLSSPYTGTPLYLNQTTTGTARTSNASAAVSVIMPPTPVANIFAPIATDAPPAVFGRRSDHPVPRLGIEPSSSTAVAKRDVSAYPYETNKFYANMFLAQQTSPSYLHPYVLNWVRNVGPVVSWGMGVSHVDASKRVFGATNAAGAASYYLNPINIHSFIVSAAGLGSSTVLTTENLTASSVVVNLAPGDGLAPLVRFPLVQGAGFVTALFTGAVPYIQTGVFFRTMTRSAQSPRPDVAKYSFLLEDGNTWYLYAHNTSGLALNLRVVNNSLAAAQNPFYGTIQLAKDPGGAEGLYDRAAGAYPTGVQLRGSTQGTVGTYTFDFGRAGLADAPLLMFALPHHVESFDSATAASVNGSVQLQTTTKGLGTAVLASSWTMVEPDLPVNMSFAPWTPGAGSLATFSDAALAKIRAAAASEVSQNMSTQSDQASMYYGGKALSKFAWIVYVIHDVLGDEALAQAGLTQLKQAFSRYSSNRQQYPLVYESAWGGVVSSASYTTGDTGIDFGNTYYNDHHFHYGYFVLTAAIIGYLDPSWLNQTSNRAYVNALLRDYANPSTEDPYFPAWRSFDWYHGHSWAHGLYDTMDGKDQESSSEDVMAAYAMKMWGAVAGDAATAGRGNLVLAVLARALNKYYLYDDTNAVEPGNFIANRVAGILFENKIDHTTYFGTNPEYIQGIHMLPLLPSTPLVRSASFVSQEWATWFDGGRADEVAGGWRGILYGNLATADPAAAWAFFSADDFDAGYLDGGASLTWYLAFSGALNQS